VAGNVAGDDETASLEYAAEHLHVPLIVVMGHTHCGAVSAALEGGTLPGKLPNQNEWARGVSEENPEVIAVGLLRPGYSDGEGHQSTGVRGLTTGDNYTPEVVDAIEDGIDRLKQTYRPRAVVLAGHSGGAAIAANILGRHPATARIESPIAFSPRCAPRPV
jgi:pimeloyl-ACP methyl ester carboxylesterase